MDVWFIIGRRTKDPTHLGARVQLVESEDDSVRTHNESLVYKRFLEGILPDFMCDSIQDDFGICISISNVKRMTQVVTVDYKWMHKDVPRWVIDASLDIYKAIKSDIRKKHKAYEEQHPKK